jgi:hypothetical protein
MRHDGSFTGDGEADSEENYQHSHELGGADLCAHNEEFSGCGKEWGEAEIDEHGEACPKSSEGEKEPDIANAESNGSTDHEPGERGVVEL